MYYLFALALGCNRQFGVNQKSPIIHLLNFAQSILVLLVLAPHIFKFGSVLHWCIVSQLKHLSFMAQQSKWCAQVHTISEKRRWNSIPGVCAYKDPSPKHSS